MRPRNTFFLWLVLACVVVSAGASTYTYSFSGIINDTTNPAVPIGTPFSGTFTYDNSAAFSGGNSSIAVYFSSDIEVNSTFTQFPEAFGWEEVAHDTSSCSYLIPGGGLADALSIDSGDHLITFCDSHRTVFASSLGLPPTIDLSEFEYIRLTYRDSTLGTYVSGVPQVRSAPEPATVFLVGTALLLSVRKMK